MNRQLTSHWGKKLAGIALFSLLGLGTASAQSLGIVWSTPVTVATGSGFDNIRPRIALVQGNTPLVIWASTLGTHKGYVARWNGTAFDQPVLINPTGQINAYTVEGPNITARGDTAYLAYTAYPATAAKVMVRRSTDGGLSWEQPMWVDSLDTDLPTFGNVGMDGSGNPIAMYIHQTETYADPRYVIRRSLDGGATWLPEVEVSSAAPGGVVCDCCTGQVYWHGGKMVATFRNNNANVRDMWATVSTDGGLTFPTALDLDSTDWVLNACPSSGPNAVFSADSIYTVFMSQGGNGSARIYLSGANLVTGAMGYNHALLDSTPNITQNYPVIASRGDSMVVAWYQNNGINPEIAVRYTFGGMSGLWNTPVQYPTGGANGIQSYPDIAWGNGMIHLVWQDDATNTVKYVRGTVGIMSGVGDGLPTWRIFPNPSNGHFRLSGLGNGMTGLRISDAMGHLVYDRDVQATEVELDVEALPNGVYFLAVQPEGAQPTVRRITILH